MTLSALIAEGNVVLHDHKNRYLIGEHIHFLHDKNQDLDFATVSSPEYSSKFIQSTEIVPNLGMGNTTYWLKFTIDNQSNKHKKWVIEIKFFGSKDHLYYKNNGKIHTHNSGYFSLGEREIVHSCHAMNIAIPQKTTYYLRVQNTGPFFFPIVLWEASEFTKNQRMITYYLFFI